ncbi:MAG: hypothetical protein QOE79_1088 [Sphingomonadales bacterium]|jgi:very-short-patch-repair endonuclease|nr:hypothetical protein [Sphingomonadales bacterium]
MGVVRRTISPHAAPLRRHATDAEQALWRELRARRLGGHKFRRQWTTGPYVADYCRLESRLIVEADGGQHCAERDRPGAPICGLRAFAYSASGTTRC